MGSFLYMYIFTILHYSVSFRSLGIFINELRDTYSPLPRQHALTTKQHGNPYRWLLLCVEEEQWLILKNIIRKRTFQCPRIMFYWERPRAGVIIKCHFIDFLAKDLLSGNRFDISFQSNLPWNRCVSIEVYTSYTNTHRIKHKGTLLWSLTLHSKWLEYIPDSTQNHIA